MECSGSCVQVAWFVPRALRSLYMTHAQEKQAEAAAVELKRNVMHKELEMERDATQDGAFRSSRQRSDKELLAEVRKERAEAKRQAEEEQSKRELQWLTGAGKKSIQERQQAGAAHEESERQRRAARGQGGAGGASTA
jgi:hypothetical protein